MNPCESFMEPQSLAVTGIMQHVKTPERHSPAHHRQVNRNQ